MIQANQIHPILMSTLSPDNATRKGAEQQLKVMTRQPGFATSCLQIANHGQANVRLFVVFRKIVF